MQQIRGIWFPDGDTHFAEQLEKNELVDGKGTYQLKKIKAALKHVDANRLGLAVDVGAHVGLWTRILAQHFLSVEAFEPVPEFIECWKLNAPDNAKLHECALSIADGVLDMEVCEDNSGNSHVAAHTVAPSGSHIQVPSRRLDAIEFESPIDFLKIDVEGWESYVVLGGLQTIKRDKPVIVIEQKPNNAERYNRTRTEALNMLLDAGYVQVLEMAGDYCLVPNF